MIDSKEHVEELLDHYRTGELEASERRRVEDHLAACEACRAALTGLTALARTVERGYAAEEAMRAAEREPDWGRLRASIVQRVSARRPAARRLGRWTPQAALAVLALVAFGVLWNEGVRRPADAERALDSAPPPAATPPGEEPGGLDAPAARRDEIVSPDRLGAEAAEGQKAAPAAETFLPRKEQPLEEEAAAQDRVAAFQKEALTPSPDLTRFRGRARAALAEGDADLAASALAQWHDSLAPREDLPPELRQAAQALADSLAAFLAARP